MGYQPVRSRSISGTFNLDLGGAFTTSTLGTVYYARSFTMSDLASIAVLNCFDQYRIDCIEVFIEHNGASTASFAPYCSAVDFDDANVPTTYEEVSHRPQAVNTAGGAGHYHKWVPRFATSAYSGAFSSFAQSADRQWIDSGSPNVQHYGLKIATRVSTAAIVYNITARIHATFRGLGIA